MSEDLSKAAGKGREIELTGPDGKVATYTASPLTMGDLAAFQQHLHNRRLKATLMLMEGVTGEERGEMIRQASRDTVDDGDMQNAMSSFDGFQFILWRCLRKSIKDLTLEQTGEMFAVKDLERILPVIQAISGIDDENPPKEVQPVTP